MRFVRTPIALAVIMLCSACGDDAPGNLREWTADDHLHPQQADPSRVPPDQPQSAQASPQQIAQAAQQLFQVSCGGCHGAGGAGDGDAAPVQDMPNFTSAEWQESKGDADIARAIRMGQGLMPAYGSQLNDRGIAALVAHIRRLGPGGAAPEGAAPEGAAPEGAAPAEGADAPAPEEAAPEGEAPAGAEAP